MDHPGHDGHSGHDDHGHEDWDDADARWAELYERQAARGERVPEWIDALDLGPGDDAVEIGSGPGYTALRTAEAVVPGRVYALERHAGALAYLRRRAVEAGVENVHPVATDAEALAARFDAPVTALLTYVLHHADRPPRVLVQTSDALAPGSRLFVCEYHPDADGEVGPPIERRIDPSTVRAWLVDAGFAVGERLEFENESYAFVATRS